MPIVIDASAVVAWLLGEGPERERVKKSLTRTLLVPAVWPPEVANALVVAERRGRITASLRGELAARVSALDVEICPSPGVRRITDLAARTGLTAYDAEYLHAALDRTAELLTLDGTLAAAARREGVSVL